MEVLTEEESRLLMESMSEPFTRQPYDETETARLSSSDQSVLLLHGPGEPYQLTQNHCIPSPKSDREILIKVVAVGLNPIDWKGPDYNFGLPSLPWINGRDFAGVVVKAHRSLSRIRVGDVILSPSTDYRDIRKAAFQEYVISTEHNCARVPGGFPVQRSAAVGVAFVAAALALGVCCGVNFAASTVAYPAGPDLYQIARQVDSALFAPDILEEVLHGITQSERAQPGDWLAIWGASSATGLVALQLAKKAHLRTICIVDVERYGETLLDAGADLLVDRLDTTRAIAIIRGVTRNRLRFALDTVGSDTAAILQTTLSTSSGERAHLVGLAGLPKTRRESVVHHHVPLKAFHNIPPVGDGLMMWLEKLLLTKSLMAPQVEVVVGGLSGINSALDKLRNGEVMGKRLVVPLLDFPSASPIKIA